MCFCVNKKMATEEQWDGFPIQGSGVGLVSSSEVRDGTGDIVLYMRQLPPQTLHPVPTEAVPPHSPPPPPSPPPVPTMGFRASRMLGKSSITELCLLRKRKDPIGKT